MSQTVSSSILRIIDANLNRLREGLRVLEDIRRYGFSDREGASNLKKLRHQARLEEYSPLLSSRDIENDVLKVTTKSESQRVDLSSVLLANFKRTQESARVLEEILKLSNPNDAERFKEIRYALYALESDLI
ncbi:MAG: thiamine-phosphate pyrophosphorylase [Campylobacteraceae bacterium]|nr:thiamine-phosphate pyrophosphorylase [Campylobacteraceae bacterium]